MFSVLGTDETARVGRLITRRGAIETPFFMPVVTQSGSRTIGPNEYSELGADALQSTAAGASAVIANSLIASFWPGLDALAAVGGLRGFLQTQSVLFTDSGGYQGTLGTSFVSNCTDDGLEFTARWSGQTIFLTAELSMRIQQTIASDVAIVLDDLPPAHASVQRCREAIARTHRWAVRCLEHHADASQLLFGVCHGGAFDDLRAESAAFVQSLGFDGIALGGIAVENSRAEKLMAVKAAVSKILDCTPRYVMGIGNPLDILEMVAMGVDCFDAAFPTIQSRKGILLTSRGPVDISLIAEKNNRNIDEDCSCQLCSHATASDFVQIRAADRSLAERLQAEHNICFMVRFMGQIRDAIRASRFAIFKSEFERRWEKGVSIPAYVGIP
jgi:queuine tRNA-ribosyltransferase